MVKKRLICLGVAGLAATLLAGPANAAFEPGDGSPAAVTAAGSRPAAATSAGSSGGASALAATELIANGTFASGLAPWTSPTSTPIRVENGRLRADAPGGKQNPWDAMVSQKGFALQAGKSYTFSFDAAASASVTAQTTVQLGASPYTHATAQAIALTTTSKRFSYTFTSPITTTNGEVTYQIGGAAAYTFYLDNVSLTTEGDTGGGNGPIDMTSGFYVDPNSNPHVWARDHAGDSRAARIESSIGSKPMGRWFGNWSGDIAAAVGSFVGAADAADKLPILVAYNIPGRDCGGHSGGGAGSPEAYRTWISAFAGGIGTRPAVVIVEPDALAQLDCLPNDTERQIRTDMIKYASEQFKAKAPNAWVYLDAAHSGWFGQRADEMAQRLNNAGIRNVRGFVSNVSNYQTTGDSVTYSNNINTALQNRYGYKTPFVVDTSRNGNGSNGEWCNPPGRKLGAVTQTGGGAEMLLWVKVPGDSDGPCGTAPNTPAGTFDPAIAIRLIDGT